MRIDVIAFSDNVGSVCGFSCGGDVVTDITGDHGEEADAGLDVNAQAAGPDRFCMGCGKHLKEGAA